MYGLIKFRTVHLLLLLFILGNSFVGAQSMIEWNVNLNNIENHYTNLIEQFNSERFGKILHTINEENFNLALDTCFFKSKHCILDSASLKDNVNKIKRDLEFYKVETKRLLKLLICTKCNICNWENTDSSNLRINDAINKIHTLRSEIRLNRENTLRNAFLTNSRNSLTNLELHTKNIREILNNRKMTKSVEFSFHNNSYWGIGIIHPGFIFYDAKAQLIIKTEIINRLEKEHNVLGANIGLGINFGKIAVVPGLFIHKSIPNGYTTNLSLYYLFENSFDMGISYTDDLGFGISILFN